MGKEGYNVGDIGFIHLNASNSDEALDFYSQVAGWESKGEPMPGFKVFGVGEENLGAIKACEDGQPPSWMPYITVADLDATIAKAEKLGGKKVMQMDVPNDGGSIAVIQDPQGVLTGLGQYK